MDLLSLSALLLCACVNSCVMENLRGAIKCYRCNNDKLGCDDPFNDRFSDRRLILVQCFPGHKCIKVITKDEQQKKVVVRDCVQSHAFDTCSAISSRSQDLVFCETCDRDACNCDSKLTPTMLLLIVTAKVLLDNL